MQRLRHGREQRPAVEVTRDGPLNLHERRQLLAGEPQVPRGPLQSELEIAAGLLERDLGAQPFELDARAVGEQLEDLLERAGRRASAWYR